RPQSISRKIFFVKSEFVLAGDEFGQYELSECIGRGIYSLPTCRVHDHHFNIFNSSEGGFVGDFSFNPTCCDLSAGRNDTTDQGERERKERSVTNNRAQNFKSFARVHLFTSFCSKQKPEILKPNYLSSQAYCEHQREDGAQKQIMI